MRQPTRLQNLQFAEAMLKEIRRRIQSSDVDLLKYLIDMAAAEAEERAEATSPVLRKH
ncbi:hypothetical protein ACVDG8_029345 [Mesorhizobium sp. ORM8.1]